MAHGKLMLSATCQVPRWREFFIYAPRDTSFSSVPTSILYSCFRLLLQPAHCAVCRSRDQAGRGFSFRLQGQPDLASASWDQMCGLRVTRPAGRRRVQPAVRTHSGMDSSIPEYRHAVAVVYAKGWSSCFNAVFQTFSPSFPRSEVGLRAPSLRWLDVLARLPSDFKRCAAVQRSMQLRVV